jgi:hypothetical protein
LLNLSSFPRYTRTDPTQHILSSFATIVSNISALAQQLNVGQLEADLNTLRLAPMANMHAWNRAWDSVKKYIGLVAQMYGHFQGFVRGLDDSVAGPENLRAFALSVIKDKNVGKDSSLETALEAFHAAVQNAAASGAAGVAKANVSEHLFTFLRQRLEEVRWIGPPHFAG